MSDQNSNGLTIITQPETPIPIDDDLRHAVDDAGLYLEHATLISLAIDGLESVRSKRAYQEALIEFYQWHMNQGSPIMSKALINSYKAHLQNVISPRTGQPLARSSINLKLSAVRKLVAEAADNGLIDEQTAGAIQRVKGAKAEGTRAGYWLTKDEAQALLDVPDPTTKKGLRDRAVLAVLLGCALRREECAALTVEHIQQRESRWVIVDLIGKRGKIRSVPMPSWVKVAINDWTSAAGIIEGNIWRPMRKGDRIAAAEYGESMSTQAIWRVVTGYAAELGYDNLAPHDMRRTAAKLMLAGGAKLEQISMVLGHSSLEVTKKYLGVDLDLQNAATDKIGLAIKARQKRLPNV
jgi:site-specific recombinase XerD